MTRTRKTPSHRYYNSTRSVPTSRTQTTLPKKSRFHFKWRWFLLIVLLFPLGSHIIKLDVQVRKQFEGKRWELPARVYAQPLEMYKGMRLEINNLVKELKATNHREFTQLNAPGQYVRKGNDFFIITREFQFWDSIEPSRQIKIHFNGNQIVSMIDFNTNQSIAILRIEPRVIGKIYPAHHEDRLLVSLPEVPPLLIDALLAMEDRSFYHHIGISLRGLVRALVENIKEGDWVQGGSTITQQLIKNLYLTSERSLIRKYNEALMSLLLEWHYTKEQILEAYLNEVFLGQDGERSIDGMGTGAQFYFGRPLEELKLHEMALLVSLVRAASYYNPRKYPERAIKRRDLVLNLMAEQGIIGMEQAKIAKSAPLGITKEISGSVFPYPAFLELVHKQLLESYREEDLQSEGLQIFTTLNPVIQETAEKAMLSGIKQLEKENFKRVKKLEGSMLVTNSENGELLALVNGRNPHYAGFNRPLNAFRQIGSLVKPAIYLAALEKANIYSLSSTLNDENYEWVDKRTGEAWKPQNYDYRVHGQVPLLEGLTMSYNLATVRLGMELGLEKVRTTLRRLGVKREFTVYPSMLLGSINLTPLEVTQMYQTIASGGFQVPVRAIREVLNHDGRPLQRYSLSVDQSFDSNVIYLLNYAMQQVIRWGTGKKVGKELPSDMIFAGKTGTTNDLRDSWFVGFGSELLTVTWLGRDDNKSMGLSGSTGAMRIWSDFIRTIRPNAIAPVTPRRVKWRWLNCSVGVLRIPYISGGSDNFLVSNEKRITRSN